MLSSSVKKKNTEDEVNAEAKENTTLKPSSKERGLGLFGSVKSR